MFNSLWPHGLHHARNPGPSPSPTACLNSWQLSWWCHPISVIPFSFCPKSFPSSGSFLMSQFFTSGDQSIGVSAGAWASTLVLPINIQVWFPLELTGLISLQSKGVFSNTTVQKHQFFSAQPSLWSKSDIHTWLLEKIIALTIQTFVGKLMSLLFNALSSLSYILFFTLWLCYTCLSWNHLSN